MAMKNLRNIDDIVTLDEAKREIHHLLELQERAYSFLRMFYDGSIKGHLVLIEGFTCKSRSLLKR